MVISSLRNYLKSSGPVSITDIAMAMDEAVEDLVVPLKILEDKGYIVSEYTTAESGCKSGCSGCKISNSCKSDKGFKIYIYKN